MNVLCHVTFSPLCGLTKYTVVGVALNPTLTLHMLVSGPGVSQVISLGRQCRCTELRTQDSSIHVPGHAVKDMEAVHTLAWSKPHMYVPTEPTAAKARPISVLAALIHLYIPPALNLSIYLFIYLFRLCHTFSILNF